LDGSDIQKAQQGAKMASSVAAMGPGGWGAIGIGCGCLVFLLLFMGIVALGVFALNNSEEGGWDISAPTGDGSLANLDEIPAVLRAAFESAGREHEVSPAFIAAIFWKENGKNWRTENYPTSPAGANGPFQFLEKTWEGWTCPGNDNGVYETDPSKICAGYGQDGDGDGIADVQNLLDSAYAAADLLGSNGAAPYTTNLDTLRDVASRYNSGQPWSVGQTYPETADYVPDVIAEYQRILALM
jgi:peptidoglycan DL-endopeptidase CwlO